MKTPGKSLISLYGLSWIFPLIELVTRKVEAANRYLMRQDPFNAWPLNMSHYMKHNSTAKVKSVSTHLSTEHTQFPIPSTTRK